MDSKKELEIIRNNYNNGDRYTPKGYVFCYDGDGKLLFHTHNMIVKSGREKIFKALTTTNNSLNLGTLHAILGNSSNLVSSDDNKSNLGDKTIEISLTDTDVPSHITYSADTTNLIYKFTIVYTSDVSNGIESISTLALTFGDGENDLFSRVVFPAYATSSNKLTFSYYLYF